MNTEAIVYLMRKTTLTKSEIGKLKPAQFVEIVKEVQYQESLEDYRTQHSVASILAAIANTIPRKHGKAYQARDFLSGKAPERVTVPLEKMAEEEGIKLPVE